jgi:PEGA domain
MVTMVRVNRAVVAFAAAFALAVPTLAYAQHGGHGGGGGGGHMGGGSARSSGGRAPSSVGNGGSVAAAPTAVPSTGRNRTGQPTIGTAGQRPTGGGPGSVAPFFFPGGLGFGYGLAFNPFFGSAAFGFGFGPYYGYGYDPFFYDSLYPFGYGYSGLGYPGLGYGYPWGYGSLGYGYPATGDPSAYDDQYRRGGPPPESQTSHETGAIRLKVSPETAQVYIDGTLAGTASDFDGMVGHHLVLEVGTHQLELRADGHETFHDTIVVEANKTLTERASLKKTK